MPGDDKPQYVVMATDRKLPQFAGLPSKPGDLSVEQFELECKRCFKVWGTPEDQQGFLVGRACIGEAKTQLQLLDDASKDDVVLVFTHLKEAYADKAPFLALIQAFYGRQQLPGESVRQYALALNTVLWRANDKDSKQLPAPDRTLRDRFIAGLHDRGLRKDLLRLVREKEDVAFKVVREEALHLSGEYDSEVRAEPTMKVALQSAGSPSAVPSDDTLSAQVARLTAELAAIKGQVGQQSAPRQNPPRGRPRGRSDDKWSPDGQPFCRRCDGLGHFERECFAPQGQSSYRPNMYTSPAPSPSRQGN
ncbi:hypothetical protein Bbelb_399520 [Branchiostoma belcheri]|nr:hypothetical protein Bbelb_399520 [Branchiostoma belcheri]